MYAQVVLRSTRRVISSSVISCEMIARVYYNHKKSVRKSLEFTSHSRIACGLTSIAATPCPPAALLIIAVAEIPRAPLVEKVYTPDQLDVSFELSNRSFCWMYQGRAPMFTSNLSMEI